MIKLSNKFIENKIAKKKVQNFIDIRNLRVRVRVRVRVLYESFKS